MVVFERPHSLLDVPLHYCPGCTHGIIHRLVAQAIDDLGIEGKTVGIAPVGGSVLAYNYFKCDMIEASHGRAPASHATENRTAGDSPANAPADTARNHAATFRKALPIIPVSSSEPCEGKLYQNRSLK